MLDYTAIGKRIKDMRKGKKMTQKCIAEQLDVSPEYMSRVETGTVSPSMTFLRRVCAIANISEMELLFGITVENMTETSKELNEILLSLSPEKKALLLEIAKTIAKYN